METNKTLFPAKLSYLKNKNIMFFQNIKNFVEIKVPWDQTLNFFEFLILAKI